MNIKEVRLMAKTKQSSLNHVHVGILAIASIILALLFLLQNISLGQTKGTGFDEFGYNYTARVFNGDADGVDRTNDDKIWGDATYAKDHLKMSWSKAWDDARFNGAP